MVPLPDTWKITVPLVADAFAYGARVAMSTAQVVQSPADLTGPTRTAMRVVLPAIKGDAPTPLRVVLTPAATSAAGINAAWLVGCLTGLASMSDPVVDIGLGDGLTAGAGTATGSSNTAFFSGSYRAVTISAGANFLQRLSGNLSAVPAGRYKVLLRYEVDSDPSANKTYLFAFGTAPTSSFAPTYGTSVQLTMPLATPTTVVYRSTSPTTPAVPAHRRRHLMPGLRGALSIRVNDGRTDRIVTRYCRGLKFTKVAPGGHQSLSFTMVLPRNTFTTSAPRTGSTSTTPAPAAPSSRATREPHPGRRPRRPAVRHLRRGRHGAGLRRDPRPDLRRPRPRRLGQKAAGTTFSAAPSTSAEPYTTPPSGLRMQFPRQPSPPTGASPRPATTPSTAPG
jgi:hypothetical protein